MTCFPLHFARLAPTSLRQSAAPVQSGPPLETATVPPRELRKDRQRRRQSSSLVMNEGDQACPETRPCPHPSPGGRKPTRTLAGKADGTDVLLGNVESQHRHAAQLYTHANAFCERLIGTMRRECLDFVIPWNERHVRRLLKEWVGHYNQGRPHSSLGPGIPEPASCSQRPKPCGHYIPRGHRVVAKAVLNGLHHEYRLERQAA